METVNECRNYALRRNKFEQVKGTNEDMKKKPVEKFIDFFSEIDGEVVKYSSVCVGPYIKDIKRKYSKKGNNCEDNKRGLSCAKLSQQSIRFLGPMELFFWFELLMVELLNC